MSNEVFTVIDGEKTDLLIHDKVLNDPVAKRQNRAQAEAQALTDGVNIGIANTLYGG